MAGKIRKSNLHQDVKTMVTDMISEQALDSANFDSVLSSKTTDDITEGSTNQYYTSTRADSDFDARLATKTTGDISEGSNLYYTDARADARIAAATTADLTEGSNLYYTTARGDSDTGVYISGDRSYGNITTTGYIRGPSTFYIDPAPVDSDAGLLVIRGDLQVDGTTTTVNSTTVSINDKNIVLADSAANASEADGAGITVNGASATITYNAANDEWDFNKDINVTGNITFGDNHVIVSDNDDNLVIESSSAEDIVIKPGSGVVEFRDAGESGSPLRMKINTDGNVGIGTSSPSAKLDVVSSGTGAETIAEFGNGNITKGLTIETNGNLDWGFNATNRNLTFSTSQTERMRITSGGDVVIGSDGGYTRGNLHIGASKSYASPYNYRDDTLLTIENFTSLEPAVLGFVADYAGSNRYGNIIWHPASSQGGSYFTINGDIQDVAHLVVTGDGDVGIGETNPSQKLHVDGIITSTNSGQGTGQLQIQGYGNSGYINMTGSNDLIFRLGSGFSEKLRITSNGDVSIGSDHAGFSGWRVLNMRQLSTGALINFEDDDSTRAFTFASQGSGMRYQAHIAGGYHRWETNANPNPLYIKDSGNVGINRAINLDSTVTIEQLTDGTDGGIRIYGSNSNSIRGQMYYDGTQSFVIHGTSGPSGEFSTLRFATGTYNNPQIRMSINKDNGYVGIGTTNPGKLLTLSRATEAANEQLEFRVVGGISNNNYDGIKWSQGSSGGTTLATQRVHYYTTGEVDMGFSLRNDANILYLKRGGNVGIGTSSPNWQFTVQGSGTGSGVQDGHAMIRSTTAVNPAGLMFVNQGNTASYNDLGSIQGIIESGNAKGALRFITRNSDGNNSDIAERMRISSNGNVAIGADAVSFIDVGNVPNLKIGVTSGSGSISIGDCNTADSSLNIRDYGGKSIGFWYSNSKVGGVTATSSGVTYNTTSDRRLKDNITTITDGKEKLLAMKPVTHTWINDPEAPQVHGFIAQEMQEVIPEAVSGDAESDDMMSMDYGRITPVIVAALQDALKEIEQLKTRINELEAE